MSTPAPVRGARVGKVQRYLVHRLSEALVPVLTEGSWQQMGF